MMAFPKPKLHTPIQTNSRSISLLKEDIRKKFKDWKKNLRYDALNQNRKLHKTTDFVTNKLLELRLELQKNLDPENIEYFEETFKQVEEDICAELLQVQAEQYERDLQNEVNSLVERHLSLCIVCNEICEGVNPVKKICYNCNNAFVDL